MNKKRETNMPILPKHSESHCSNGLCSTLDKLGVPRDSKWRALILYMRSIADFDFLSDMQKSKIQSLVVEILQMRRFDEESFKQIVERQERIISQPWHDKLQAALDETEMLLKHAQLALGRRKGDLQSLERSTVETVEKERDIELIIGNIKKGFHEVISLMEEDAKNLVQLSQTDELTGLSNRRAFEQSIEQMVDEARTLQLPLCLVMIDIDNFKRFNDEHGHLIGDQALKAIGLLLNEFVRQKSEKLDRKFFAGRFGGEEFALLMPGTNLEEAVILAEALRARTEKFNFTIRDPEGLPLACGIKISVSLGVAQYAQNWSSAFSRRLIDAADQALYQAKSEGRNRVCVYHGMA